MSGAAPVRAPHPGQGKTGSRAGARHRGQRPRTAQPGPGGSRPSFLRLTRARTAVSIPSRPDGSPGSGCPGHRRDGPDTEVAGSAESGAWAAACRSSPVLRTVGRSLPPCPAPPRCSQGAPCAEVPSGNGRCPALLKRRPHRPGHSSGGKDASLHPSFHFPISLSLSLWAPSPSSLLSLPRKTGVLGRRLGGGDTALCLFLGWEPGSGGRPSLPRWRLLSIRKPQSSCLSPRASEKGSAGPLEWKPLHGSLRWGPRPGRSLPGVPGTEGPSASPGHYFRSGPSVTSRVTPRPTGGTGPEPEMLDGGVGGNTESPVPAAAPLISPSSPASLKGPTPLLLPGPNWAVKLLLNTW